MKTLSLLGSTGSIGRNTLELVRQFPGRFRVAGLAAGHQIDLLADQILEFRPECVSVAEETLVDKLGRRLPADIRPRILCGVEGLCTVATLPGVDMVVSAVVGAVGLLPALAAIEAGKDIGLANKETLVMAGRLIMTAVREHKVRLLPVDSEHSAIFQALEAGRRQDVARILLTASGGPFRAMAATELPSVTPKQALAHPNWSMGRKISIDSATLMNKGLEVIEARWLFDAAPDQIEVVVHPQSIIHSMVGYVDGSVLAQLGAPDMRTAIGYALTYPERSALNVDRLDFAKLSRLDFEAPDEERFPALRLARTALERGGLQGAIMNAAEEVAFHAFVGGRIGFLSMADIAEQVMDKLTHLPPASSMDDVFAADEEARRVAAGLIG